MSGEGAREWHGEPPEPTTGPRAEGPPRPPVGLLILRHAAPAAGPDRLPARWPLTPDGLRAAAALRWALPDGLPPDGLRAVASTERKAVRTVAAATGRQPLREPGFGEVCHPFHWSADAAGFRRSRVNYLSGEEIPPGWEPPGEVAARFAAALERHLGSAEADGRAGLLVGTHGMALSLWAEAAGLLDGVPVGEFWSGLRMPDLLEAVDGTLRRVADGRR